MIVAIDYDLTYTAHPECFEEIVNVLKRFGHHPIIVTARSSVATEQLSSGKIESCRCPVYYTDGAPKHWYMQQFHSIHVDIWIDDDPKGIIEGR